MLITNKLWEKDFSKIKNFIGLGISIFLIIIYLWASNYYIINIPFWDDYYIVFRFLENFFNAESFWEKLKLLFSQSNEHRIVTCHLLMLADCYLFGSVDLKHTMFFVNISLLLYWWFFYKISNFNWWQFLPVSLLILVPISRIVGWYSAGNLNLYVLMFSLFSLFFLQKNSTKNLLLALLFAFLATFTFGSGIFTFVAGIVLLSLQRPFRSNHLYIWLGFFLFCVIIYFIGYESPKGAPSIIDTILSKPLSLLLYPVVFFGNFFKSFYNIHPYVNPILGALVLGYTAVLVIVKRDYFKNHPFLSSCLFLILFTVMIGALTRAGFGFSQANTPRYRFISMTYLVLLYIVSFQVWPKYFKVHLGFILFFSVFFYYFRLHDNIQGLKGHREKLVTSIQYFELGEDNFLLHPIPKLAGKLMREGIAKERFKLPPLDKIVQLESIEVPLTDLLEEKKSINVKWEIVKQNKKYLSVKGWAFFKNENTTPKSRIFIVLKSDSQAIMFPVKKVLRPDINRYMASNYELDNSGFQLFLSKKDIKLPPGMYQLGLLLDNGNGKKAFTYSKHQVNL